tara:strand:- start:122 stop:916 length:795 start_codon:yes stop_codon:yes gene_type:complete
MLHGYPQTHIMWYKTSSTLSKYFTIIIADLRGYGSSMVVKSDLKHNAYSKREMAKDMIQLMKILGYNKFFVAGHDRGGRVAHRLARDYRKNVLAICVLDICPTIDMYESTNMEFAKNYFHWFFLIQPKNIPEKMIEYDPKAWLISCLNSWSKKRKFGQAEKYYLSAFRQKNRIHASCEDYRAAATIDLQHDLKDRDALLDIPIHVLWGENSVIGRQFNPLQIWQKYTNVKISGKSLKCGHFLPEEDPKGTVKEFLRFFKNINII